MYSEKSFKNYIFWVQVKRVFLIIILSCIGAALGILIGKILESTVKITSFNNVIIAVSTIIFFLISLLLTVGTGKQVQDGYWKIAVLRKLTVIQKNLELNNELLKNTDKSVKEKIKPITEKIIDDEEVNDDEEEITSNLYKFNDEEEKEEKKTTRKTLKGPEELNN